MKEHKYLVEELHRGKWQPLKIEGAERQKHVMITDETAERMNVYAKDEGIRYVKAEKAEAPKEGKADEKEDEIELNDLREKYKEVFGKNPHHKWSKATIEEKLAEKA